MKQFIFPLIIICLLFLSCNNVGKTDDRFLGTWVFSNAVPESSLHDGSMEGSTCKITKVDGSKESYSVDILSYQGVLFSKENDSTLKGVDADFTIKYTESNQHIVFQISSTRGMEYYKLK